MSSLFAARLGYLATVPPFAVHSSAEGAGSQPCPLQEFWPAQALEAVLHLEVPLQDLMPMHFTVALSPVSAALTGAIITVENKAAADVAKASFAIVFMTNLHQLQLLGQLAR